MAESKEPSEPMTADGCSTARAAQAVQQMLKMLVFLVLNYLLAVSAFVLVLFGVALSLGSLALCCLGVVVFQGLLFLSPLLARLDVALHNFVEPVERKLYGQIPHHGESVSSYSRPSLMVLLYFTTAKLGVGILSVLVVVITFSLPIHALASPEFRDQYFDGSTLTSTIFVVVALALLVGGLAAVPFVTKLSCVTTRLLCREVFSATIHTRDLVPSAAPSYGTTNSIQQA